MGVPLPQPYQPASLSILTRWTSVSKVMPEPIASAMAGESMGYSGKLTLLQARKSLQKCLSFHRQAILYKEQTRGLQTSTRLPRAENTGAKRALLRDLAESPGSRISLHSPVTVRVVGIHHSLQPTPGSTL